MYVQPHYYRVRQVEPCRQLWRRSQALFLNNLAHGAIPKQQATLAFEYFKPTPLHYNAVFSKGKMKAVVGVEFYSPTGFKSLKIAHYAGRDWTGEIKVYCAPFYGTSTTATASTQKKSWLQRKLRWWLLYRERLCSVLRLNLAWTASIWEKTGWKLPLRTVVIRLPQSEIQVAFRILKCDACIQAIWKLRADKIVHHKPVKARWALL